MRFLADESCDFAAVQALRTAGHDVVAVAEVARGAVDSVVVELARSDKRIHGSASFVPVTEPAELDVKISTPALEVVLGLDGSAFNSHPLMPGTTRRGALRRL